MDNIEKLLDEEIVGELKNLKEDVELGDEVYNSTVNGLSKLFDKSIELKKLKMEEELKHKQLDADYELRLREHLSENEDRKARNWIAVGGIVAPLVVGSIWSWKSLKFEETGTVTSTVGKNMLNGLTKLKFWK